MSDRILPRTPEEYRAWWEANAPVPWGACWCGCGGDAPIAPTTWKTELYFQGQPRRFRKGHAGKNKPNLKPCHKFEYEIDSETGCWIWQGAVDENGYGVVVRNSRQHHAHRYHYSQAFGPIDSGIVIHHICFNKGCVRISHLEPQTRAEHARLHNQSERWSRDFDYCVECGTMARKHNSHGRCINCHQRHLKARKRRQRN